MKSKSVFCVYSLFFVLLACTPAGEHQEYEEFKHVLSIETQKHKIVWEKFDINVSYSSNGSMIVSSPNSVFIEGKDVNTLQQYIFALNTSDGSLLWRTKVQNNASHLLVYGSVLLRSSSGVGQVEAYKIDDGQLMWKTTLPGAHSIIDLYEADDKIFVNTNNSLFFILGTNGDVLEKYQTSQRMLFETGGYLYSSNASRLNAKNELDDKKSWSLELVDPFEKSPLLVDDDFYIVTGGVTDNHLYSVNILSGKLNWSSKSNVLSNLYQKDYFLYLLSADNSLKILDITNGSLTQRISFLPSFDVDEFGRYYVSVDPASDVVVLSFGDNNQILGLRYKP